MPATAFATMPALEVVFCGEHHQPFFKIKIFAFF